MRNHTLNKKNILVVALVVLALLLTFSSVLIATLVPAATGEDYTADSSRREMLDNITVTDTNGTIDANTPVEAPAGYAKQKITNSDELKAFLTSTDKDTLMYGYIELAAGTTSIDLDWGTNNGTNTVLTSNKIFDGRGYVVNLTTTPGDKADMARADLLSFGTDSIEGSPRYAGGWFLAASYGTIKNTRFDYAKFATLQCKEHGGDVIKNGTTAYGIVVGYNAGTIDNVKLTMAEESQFYVDKQEPSDEYWEIVADNGHAQSRLDKLTILVGGVAGINISDGSVKGQIVNTTVDINGTLWAQAQKKGRPFKAWPFAAEKKSGSRATVGGLVGRMQGVDSLVQNCVITGGTSGKIFASSAGKNPGLKGFEYRFVATAVAANSEYSRTQGNAFGTINGVIDAYKGSVSGSSSGTQEGTFDCAENVLNVYGLMSRDTTKRLHNCGCNHNSQSTHKTLEAESGTMDIHFTENVGELAYTAAPIKPKTEEPTDPVDPAATSQEEISRIYAHESYELSVNDFKPTINFTNTLISFGDERSGEVSGIVEPDTNDNKVFTSVAVIYCQVVDILPKEGQSTNYVYTGNAQSGAFSIKLVDGTIVDADPALLKYEYTMNNRAVDESILPGVYTAKPISSVNPKVAYVGSNAGVRIVAPFSEENPAMVSYSIDRATITTNEAEADKWYNDYKYTINTAGLSEGAIDRISYSVGDTNKWTYIDGTSYTVANEGKGLVHHFRGYKGDTQVTETLTTAPINVDNTNAEIKDINYTDDIATWTDQDITATFGVEDLLSGVQSVTLTTEGTPEPQTLTAAEGVYTFIMNGNLQYTITAVDNAGNTTTQAIKPCIDKASASISLEAKYKDGTGAMVAYDPDNPGLSIYTNITVKVTGTAGPSGYTVSYAKITDGVAGEYTAVEVGASGADITFSNETNATYTFKVTTGTNKTAEQELLIKIDKYKITITNDNLVDNGKAEYTKEYDSTTAIADGGYTLQSLMLGSEALSDEDMAKFTVQAAYADANAGANKTVVYNVVIDSSIAELYVVDNQIASTTNGTITKKDVTMTIGELSREYGYENPTEYDVTFVGVLNDEEKDLVYSLSIGADKNSSAGAYDITLASQSSTNYNITMVDGEGTGKFVVSPRKVFVTFDGYKGLVYNGSEQNTITASYQDMSGTQVDLTIEYNSAPINAGDYVATAVFIDSNYVNSTGNNALSFRINKAKLNVTVEDVVADYDGNTHPVVATSNVDGVSIVITYNGKEDLPTNAGIYIVDIQLELDNVNYVIEPIEATVTINKIAFSGLVFDDVTGIYDGSTYSATLTTNGGATLPEGTSVVYGDNEFINAGDYTVTVKVSNPNYITQELTANVKIAKGDITSKLSINGKTAVYDGSEYKLDLTLAEGFTLPDGISITWTNNGLTNVGKNLVGVKIYGDNYSLVSLEAWLEVTPAAIGEDIGFENDEMYFGYQGEDITITLEGNLEGYDVQYDRNVLTYAGLHYVKATVSKPNYATKTFSTLVTVGKYSVELNYTNLPADLKVKIGEVVEGITASFVDLQGNTVEVKLTITGGTTEEGYITIAAKMPINYVADNADLAIEVVKGTNTGVIIGASVGGSVGGLAVIGGAVAFFVIKKKKSII